MRIPGQVIFGILIILIGLMFLLGNFFDVDVGALCFPTALILIGVWLLIRPRLVGPDTALRMRIFGPIRRSGAWRVGDEEIWLLIGDVYLDMTQAEIPPGETHVRVFAFISNVRLLVPQDVGVSASSMAFITDTRVFGQKRGGFVIPSHVTSEGYENAGRKVQVETISFIADVRARQA